LKHIHRYVRGKLEFYFLSAGVILGRNGGMIKQLFLPFYFGLGGPVGRGDQYMPWIHIHDMANLLLFAIENDSVHGVLNGVAPQVCSISTEVLNWNYKFLTNSSVCT
jgi:NAD dependent epimerase/dehydratase family enzyme